MDSLENIVRQCARSLLGQNCALLAYSFHLLANTISPYDRCKFGQTPRKMAHQVDTLLYDHICKIFSLHMWILAHKRQQVKVRGL